MLRDMPVPVIDTDSKEFWDGCAVGELRLPSCSACGYFRWPPGPMCPRCQAMGTTWVSVVGEGEIYCWTVVSNPPGPGLDADIPYVIALVEMSEGPRLIGNVIGCAPEEVFAGMRVKTVFERGADDMLIYNFRCIAVD